MSATTPIQSGMSLPTFSILLNGKEIDSAYPIQSIEVGKAVNKISFARICIYDGNPALQDFQISNKADFLVGAAIEIKAGYNLTEKSIFKGIITRHEIRISEEAAALLVVECRDKAIAMTMGKKTATFSKKKDSEVLSAIIGNYGGLTASVDSTTYQHPKQIQYQTTDWDFLVMRAEVNGLFVTTEAATVAAKKPEMKSPSLTLSYGDTIINLQAYMDTNTQIASTQTTATQIGATALTTASGVATNPNIGGDVTFSTLSGVIGSKTYTQQTAAPLPQSPLQTWASAQLLKSNYSKIKGKVTFFGNASVNPLDVITLKGVGNRFNGNILVGAIVHKIKAGIWQTEARLGLEFEWFADETANGNTTSANWIPAMQGIHSAFVKQIHQDPDGQYRVLLTIPILGSADDGVWARIAHEYATNGQGFFFMPEINDEVAIAFADNNPMFPIIIGALYSKNIKPPTEPDADNTTKQITTKSKLNITFNDKDTILTLKTPAGNTVVLDDKQGQVTVTDKTGNSIKMTSSGITIDSKGDLKLNASGGIKLSATGNVEISSSGGDVKVSGLNISNAANVKFAANGQAMAELTSSGQTTVKGTLVMIN